MKHCILLILVTFASINLAYGQEKKEVKYKNPFEQLGYKNIKVATLSKGKYQEFHDLDSIVQIGSTLINTNTRQIVGFVTNDTTKQSQNASVPSRWMSVDPLADEFYNWSPYNFCTDNPITNIDPDGRLSRPIYDTDGNLLGTDDTGLQGEAVVMKKENFKQGMDKAEADKHSLGQQALSTEEAKSKFNESYNSLSSRPDYDGIMTLSELNQWYSSGEGKPVYIDVSKVDISTVGIEDLKLNTPLFL